MDDMNQDDKTKWVCPYPDCDWSPSRPVESEARLTQAVVRHEIKKHRTQHAEANQS